MDSCSPRSRWAKGFLDLKQIVQLLRQKDPNMIFNLEMITRDPLKIPVYTPKYWATFDDAYSPLPGRDLAKVLALVKKQPSQEAAAEGDRSEHGGSSQAGGRLQPAVHRVCPPEPGPVALVLRSIVVRPSDSEVLRLRQSVSAMGSTFSIVLYGRDRDRMEDGGAGRLRRSAPPRSAAVELSP